MPSDSNASNELTDEFNEALTEIQESYAGKPDLETLGKSSIQGMLRQLDPHSTFFTKSEFERRSNRAEQSHFRYRRDDSQAL